MAHPSKGAKFRRQDPQVVLARRNLHTRRLSETTLIGSQTMRNFSRLEDLFALFLLSLPLLPVLLFLWLFAWNWYESTYAPVVALRALDTFIPPCHAPGMELDCQTGRAVPKGPYQIVNVELGPVSGVFVTARSADGMLVDMDVFPALFSRHLVQIESIGRAE